MTIFVFLSSLLLEISVFLSAWARFGATKIVSYPNKTKTDKTIANNVFCSIILPYWIMSASGCRAAAQEAQEG